MKKKTTNSKRPAASAGSTPSLEKLDIGLDRKTLATAVGLLAPVLANQHVLYIKTRNFHWNLTGHRFHTLHAFFEEQYQALAEAIDETAERMRMLGSASPGSMQEFLQLATLKERAGALVAGDDAIVALRDDHEAAARELRKAIDILDEAGDAGTADFLTNLLQRHEQAAWMLRSFLE